MCRADNHMERRMIVSTSYDVAGYRIVRHIGVVRGLTVRSRSLVGNILGSFESIFGGKLSIYVALAEAARQEAYHLKCAEAESAGANAIIGMQYDATEIMEGVTEVLAYGTAVVIERI